MPSYPIYPVQGRKAQQYLLTLGCSVDQSNRLNIPDTLLVKHNAGGTYAVRRRGETVFCLQYYPLDHWRVVLPVSYRMSFSQLLRAYSIDKSLAERLVGGSGVRDLIRDIPVQRSLAGAALKWLSNYTGHPYDLENVRVVLADSLAADCPVVCGDHTHFAHLIWATFTTPMFLLSHVFTLPLRRIRTILAFGW